MTWYLKHKPGDQSNQVSFLGGKPRLPAGKEVPSCQLCGSQQTFFFQVAIPKGGWAGSTLAVYQCTRCADEDHLIPEMLNSGFAEADIPQGFLNHQPNFSFEVFPTDQGLIVSSYKETILFSEIQFVEGDSIGSFGKLGGKPDWVLEDESPSTYAGSVKMVFLLEVAPKFQFKLVPNAEPQIELDIMGESSPSPFDYYQLFIGNALYFFGTGSGDKAVYAITQV